MNYKIKTIKGYEGVYSITDDGRVFVHKYTRSDGRIFPEKFMKLGHNQRGYLSVGLRKEGKVKRVYVHRLVAQAFVPNPLSFKTVNHLDGDVENNVSTNLEWCTLSDNSIHSFRILGRKTWNKGLKGRQKNHNTSGLLKGGWNKGKKKLLYLKEKGLL